MPKKIVSIATLTILFRYIRLCQKKMNNNDIDSFLDSRI